MDREIVECLSCGLYYGRKKVTHNDYIFRISLCPGCDLPFIVGYKDLDRNKYNLSELREKAYGDIKLSGRWVR
jgi:hypothetical protein